MFDNTIKGPSASPSLDGSSLRIGIIHSRWNDTIINHLVEGCHSALLSTGLKPENIKIISVPGAWELPFAVQTLYTSSYEEEDDSSKPFDALIAIGCLIKGATMHFEYISESVSRGLMDVQFRLGVPVVFGLLTCLNEEQALLRAGVGEGGHNHGGDWGRAAVEMACLGKM